MLFLRAKRSREQSHTPEVGQYITLLLPDGGGVLAVTDSLFLVLGKGERAFPRQSQHPWSSC